ncbi:MAG: dTMP kinase [Parcubacteria group bacterium]
MSRFIIIEGDDGAGKTTFVNWLKKKHPEFVYSREPGGCKLGQEVREILLADSGQYLNPLTRFDLFWASRAENLSKVIRPALDRGQVVVSDRFDASTYAYQIGGDGRRELEDLFWETRHFHLFGLSPHYIFFVVPPHVSAVRLESRDTEKNHFDESPASYRRRVSGSYGDFHRDPRVESSIVFNADLPLEEMLESAYKLFLETLYATQA